MEQWHNLTHQFYDLLNEGGPIAWASLLIFALIAAKLAKAALRLFATRAGKLASRTEGKIDDFLVENLAGTKGWVIFIWIAYPLVHVLNPHPSVIKGAHDVAVVAAIIQILIWGMAAIRFWRAEFLQQKMMTEAHSSSVFGLLYLGVQTAFITLLILFGLSNMGINIGALLAGLGVGGIAVALAAQNVLGDLLASLSIVLDKPFVIGDFIVVGTELGTVENIGIKTTRVRSLSGEELVFSNKDLLESRIRNFKRMWERRVVQRFGVVYSTKPDQLERIPEMVKEILGKLEKVRLDRCHFFQYGASSLDFEFVFFVSDPEYNVYMDLQQKILIEMYRRFAAEKIEFAFPTQTIHVESLPMRGPSPEPL